MLEFVLFAEFGKSYKDPGFHTSERDNLLDVVYKHVYASPRWGGVSGGIWT